MFSKLPELVAFVLLVAVGGGCGREPAPATAPPSAPQARERGPASAEATQAVAGASDSPSDTDGPESDPPAPPVPKSSPPTFAPPAPPIAAPPAAIADISAGWRAAPIPEDAPVVKMTVAELHKLQSGDKIALLKAVGGKWIEVEATATDVGVHMIIPAVVIPSVRLEEDDVDGRSTHVECHFMTELPWKKVSKGSVVRIRGVISEIGMFDRGRIVEFKGKPVPDHTPESLLRFYSENREERLGGKGVIVRGPVLSIKPADNRNYELLLGDGDRGTIEVTTMEEYDFRDVKAGMKISVIGNSHFLETQDPQVSVIQCYRIDGIETAITRLGRPKSE